MQVNELLVEFNQLSLQTLYHRRKPKQQHHELTEYINIATEEVIPKSFPVLSIFNYSRWHMMRSYSRKLLEIFRDRCNSYEFSVRTGLEFSFADLQNDGHPFSPPFNCSANSTEEM